MSFRCLRCGNCCRWEGAVVLEPGDADRIAAHLGIAPEAFLAEYTRITPDRQHLSLTEKTDGSCVFLQQERCGPAFCAINQVKPRQCRRFPEHWNFPDWEKLCPGAGSQEEKHS